MYNLLIADDEYEIRTGLSRYVPWQELGFEVVGTAADGQEALSFIETHSVDVILCDISMPKLTGIELAKQLHETDSNVAIVFLSGYKEFDYAQQAIAYGVKEYLLKPTKYSELYALFTKLKLAFDQENKGSRNSIQPRLEEGKRRFDSTISRILDYVRTNYQYASLDGVSQLVHLNPQYISTYFKEKTGVNFSDYVLQIRMEKAAEFLRDPEARIYEVSERVGYSNSKNFTRTFSKYYGKSPREFRK